MFVLAGKSLGYSPPVLAVLAFDFLEGTDSGLVSHIAFRRPGPHAGFPGLNCVQASNVRRSGSRLRLCETRARGSESHGYINPRFPLSDFAPSAWLSSVRSDRRRQVWQATLSRHGKIGFGRNSRFACALQQRLLDRPPGQHGALDPLRKFPHALQHSKIAQRPRRLGRFVGHQIMKGAQHPFCLRAAFPFQFHRHQ